MEKIVLLHDIIIPKGTVFKRSESKGLYEALKKIDGLDKCLLHTITDMNVNLEKWFKVFSPIKGIWIMPENFQKCVAAGGKVMHKSLGNGKYLQICYLHGQAYHSELKRRKRQKRENFSKAMHKLYGTNRQEQEKNWIQSF